LSITTSEQANRIIAAGRTRATEIALAAIVAVSDPRAQLKAFTQMDGTIRWIDWSGRCKGTYRTAVCGQQRGGL